MKKPKEDIFSMGNLMRKFSKQNLVTIIVASTSLTACSTVTDAYVDTIDKAFAVATFKSGESQDVGKLKKYILREDTKKYVKVIDSVPLDEPLYWNYDGDIKYTALQYAVKWENEVIAQALIDRGANIDITPMGSSVTPLFQAAFSGNARLVEILLKAGANSNIEANNGKTAMDIIRPEHNGVAVAKAFLDAGVTVPEIKIAELKNYSPPKQKKKKSSGFQWGKALALGVGAVAGGGLKLDTDTQASVLSGIVLDSMKDTSGTSNLNNAVETSLENNARRAAASTSLPSSSNSETTNAANPTPENNNSSDTVGNTQAAGSATSPSIAKPTPNSLSTSNKCAPGNYYSLAEEQAEKDRIGAIMQNRLLNVPSSDYKARNQAIRDFQDLLEDWRNSKLEACGINTCLLYTSPSPRDATLSRMPSSA